MPDRLPQELDLPNNTTVHDYHHTFHIPGVTRNKALPVITLIAGLLLGIFLTSLYQNIKMPPKTVTITGKATIDADANSAKLTGTLTIDGSSFNDVKEKLSIAENNLRQIIIQAGIPSDKLAITESEPYKNSDETPPTYSVSNQFNIEFSGKTVPTASKIKDNLRSFSQFSVDDISYELTNPDRKKYKPLVRSQALQDARDQVDVIAKSNNSRVGKIVSLQEQDISDDTSYYPTSEEKIPLSASYQVKYEIF